MFSFLSILFSSIFAHVNNNTTGPSHSSGYYEGDDSPWIMGDNGPIYGGMGE